MDFIRHQLRLIGRLALATTAIAVVVGIATHNHSAQAAGSGTLTLSPSSGSHNNGDSFSVTIHENSGTTGINAVEADLTYDQTKLQFISSDTTVNPNFTGSNGACPSPSGGGGSVKIGCAKFSTNLTGDQAVATVTFKALVGSGSSAVTFANSSAILDPSTSPATNVWNGSSAGGTYSFTTPSTGGGGTGGTGGSGGTGSTGSTSTGSTSTTKSTSGSTSTKSGSTTTPAPSSTSAPAPTAAAPVTYFVGIHVQDQNNHPLANAQVTVDGTTSATTDNTGYASFNLASGQHTIAVTSNNKKVTQSIDVAAATDHAAVQSFSVTLASSRSTSDYLKLIGIIVLLLLVIGGGIGLIMKLTHDSPRLYAPEGTSSPNATAPTTPPAPSVGTSEINPTGQVFYPDPKSQGLNDNSKESS